MRLYQQDPNWIRPLDRDIRWVFDPKANPYFSHGDCQRWILEGDGGATVGRVAAFIDHKTAHINDQPTGGLGFFECIDSKKAAFRLFDVCKIWLQERGMEAMDGPVNFGERDKWWGLLIKGRAFEPNYCVPYHFGYYQALFEAYGFREYYQQYTYYRKVAGGLDESLKARAERIMKNKDYRFSHIQQVPLQKVAEDFMTIYNLAWGSYPDIKQMTLEQVQSHLNQIKPIMDKRLIWFAYYQDQPIAFAIMMPEVNQIFKHLHGRFGVWEKLKFIWLKRKGVCKKILGLAFGVVPRFQKKGVESAIFESIRQMAYAPNSKFYYEELEHNWVGDFNPQMMRVHESMGGEIRKVHATYRLLFDREKEFRRAQKVN